jgi:hypothetical protein
MNTDRTNTQAYEQDNRAYWREHTYNYGDFYRESRSHRLTRIVIGCALIAMGVFYWLTGVM